MVGGLRSRWISPIRRIGKELEQPSQREQEKDLNPFWVFEELEREQGRRAFRYSRPFRQHLEQALGALCEPICSPALRLK